MRKPFAIVLFTVLSTAALVAATNLYTEKCVFDIEGTSNVHDWKSTSTKGVVTGVLTLDGIKLKSISDIKIKIPVKSIVSEKGSVMNGKTWDALKAKKHPNIIFNLTKVNSLKKASSGYDVSVNGNLSIAGVTKRVNLKVKCTVLVGGKVKVTGSKKVKMTDYGVDPPTAFFGAMTTGDEVTLKFYIILKP